MTSLSRPLKVALLAGEPSGDILAAGLMRELRARVPEIEFIGVGGDLMAAEGLHSLFPLERLSVMGIVDVLKQLPDLLRARKEVIQYLLQQKPDIFIGVDAPDFNIPVEKKLKQAGITTVHYVSPTVWAWRQKRVFNVQKATHKVLCLFPFEQAFYDRYDVPSTFVGHTLADDIALQTSRDEALQQLGLAPEKRYVGLLPGSRHTEVSMLSEPFLQAAKLIHARHPDIEFVVPLVSRARRADFEQALAQQGHGLTVHMFDGQSRQVMIASDALMVASGTVSLEAMLLKRPMVVAYRFSRLNEWLLRWFVKVEHFSLPNLLAGDAMVPELLQHDATPERLAEHVLDFLENDQSELLARFNELHVRLQQNASVVAAKTVLQTWQQNQSSNNSIKSN